MMNSVMDANYELTRTETPDGDLVEFGPYDGDASMQLRIPETFERNFAYSETGVTACVSCRFTGERIEVVKLAVTPQLGSGLKTRDLLSLGLPAVIRSMAEDVIPDWGYWKRWDDDASWTGLKVNDEFLAQLYWLEHVSGGNPRKTLMSYLALPRSTTNLLLRRLKATYPLPTS